MQHTPIDLILIPENRQRQEFDPEALMELTESIRDNGLLHAPVVRQEGSQLFLVAGERRLRAISDLFMLGGEFYYNGQIYADGNVPYVTLGELCELAAEEAELEENIKRRDLTWQEHAAAKERLHKLRCRQAEATGESPPTPTITAAEITKGTNSFHRDVARKEILVAAHLNNPLIAKAKSAEEAFKILKKQETREKNVALATEVGKTFGAKSHTLLNVNCLEWMRQTENFGQFDVILTDPPYGMDAQAFGDAGGKLSGIEHHYDDSLESWEKLMREWTQLSFFVTKPEAHAYVFCDLDNFHQLKAMMQGVGWYVFRTPFICVKPNSGRVPLPEHGPRRQYEVLLYAIKGKKPVTHIYPDVITTTADENMSHGAQKPVALFQNLLQRSVKPGDKVLDCFAGTGPIFPAAHGFKCQATGLEMNKEYYAIAMKRLQDIAAFESDFDFGAL